MNDLRTQLLESSDICLFRFSEDAVIHFDKVCRTCLSADSIKSIFALMYENKLIRDILEECAFIKVQTQDQLPKYICTRCVTDLVQAYRFKQKCLQTQVTLEEIIKYNKRISSGLNEKNHAQIPFISHKIVEEDEINSETENETQKLPENINEHKADDEPLIENEFSLTDYEDELETDQLFVEENEDKNDNYDEPILSNDVIKGEENIKSESESGNDIKDSLRVESKKYTCVQCNEDFFTYGRLQAHRKEVKHKVLRRKDICSVCGKSCVPGHLKIHMRTHTKEKPYVCHICGLKFTLNCNLKRHVMTHTGERPHVCDYCGKGFIQGASLVEHKRLHTGETPFICSYCGEGFSQSLKHRAHLRQHEIENGEVKEAAIENEHQCQTCKKVFSSRGSLKQHEQVHSEKSFLCSYCGKGFNSNNGLRSHLKVHTGLRPYSCSVCGKTFSQIGSLKAHKLIHSGERPFVCHICSKSFIQRNHLKYHLRVHTGEKPYTCPYCNKKFSLNGTLTVHIRTHTGETPYNCDLCGKGFYDSSSMKKHRKGHDPLNINISTYLHMSDNMDIPSSVEGEVVIQNMP